MNPILKEVVDLWGFNPEHLNILLPSSFTIFFGVSDVSFKDTSLFSSEKELKNQLLNKDGKYFDPELGVLPFTLRTINIYRWERNQTTNENAQPWSMRPFNEEEGHLHCQFCNRPREDLNKQPPSEPMDQDKPHFGQFYYNFDKRLEYYDV